MPKAIYEGIYREIRSRIINGTYAFQEMLPTEAELTGGVWLHAQYRSTLP